MPGELIVDIECTDLTGNELTLIGVLRTSDERVWSFRDPMDFYRLLLVLQPTRIVGHNIIAFDWPVLKKHLPGLYEPKQILDTLVISRLLWYEKPNGHSLEALSTEAGVPKQVDFTDFSKWSPELEAYNIQDLKANHAVLKRFRKYIDDPEWAEAIETEHWAAQMCQDIHEHGFKFDFDRAKALLAELADLQAKLDREILDGFKPRCVPGKTITPRLTKAGTLNASDFRWVPDGDLTPFSEGAAFTRISFEPFNPGSPRQVVARLNELGWKPTEKTKGHIKALRDKTTTPEKLKVFKEFGWTISETNLRTLPKDAPEAAHKLAQRLTVSARVSDLEEWMREYNPADGRIHGRLLSIGAWSHRMAHRSPNTGNIASEFPDLKEYTPVEAIKKKYDGQLRGLWCVPDEFWQVGVDMESAHLRILAHLIDEPEFTRGLISGSKADGTDPHSMNKKALGDVCKSRDAAKAFIYTWLNGGGAEKVAQILECPVPLAKRAIDQFIKSYPGLDKLYKEQIPADAKRGFFVGIDGRKVIYGQEHGMLAGYLQNAEAIILKRSAWLARKKAEQIVPIKLLNLVHDEVQIEVQSSDKAVAEEVGKIFANEFRLTAEYYGLRCPFDGGVTVGKNWRGAH